MRWHSIVTFVVGASLPLWLADDGAGQIKDKDFAAELPRIAPKAPKDAVATFKLAPGFKVELAASEPALRSPVAVDFDEDGRMYVAEFPEYNQHGNPNFKERGAIKLLEDTKGTGVYDKVTTFAELDSPVALCCWDGGIFVGAVPHIYYLKDTKGTGKANVKKIIYTGFGRDKAGEGMFNSFRWGLDNRFHISTSAAGGSVKLAEAKDPQVFNVRGHGFLFDPRSLKFELIAGSAQHGMSIDDWGRKYTCDNSNPVHLLMYDGRYLLKNPYVQAPPPLLNIHSAERRNYLKRISPNEPWRIVRTRLRLKGEVPGPTETGEVSGHFTGTTGVTVYRGDAFPPEHRGTLFVGEVANNLVYHARVIPTGLTANAKRVEAEQEFLASTDNWFRPAQFANAPDGTLYVIDHYREIIETIESIPPVILKHLHIESGVNHGRIWRIVPDGFKRPALPRLSKATTAELVKLLEHPNGWHRDTASRLLYQRQDAQAVPLLQKMIRNSKAPLAVVHSLYALDGLNALEVGDVLAALLADPEPRVREHALKLSERFQTEVNVRRVLLLMSEEERDLRVRFQLAFSLGAVEGELGARALHNLAVKDSKDAWMRLAILTSAHGRRGDLFRTLADDKKLSLSAEGRTLLNALAVQIGAANHDNELAEILAMIDRLPKNEGVLYMASLMSKLPPNARDRITKSGKAGELFKELIAEAIKASSDEKLALPNRVVAVRTLGLAEFDKVKPNFVEFLKFKQPEVIQKAALETLVRFDQAGVPALIIDAWPSLSPQVRATAAETLFARSVWIHTFLDAVEKGKVKTGEVDPARIKLLQISADAKIRDRADKLFKGTQLSKRKDVIDAYQKSLTLKGDVKNGKALFKKNCTACHRMEGVGEQIGAELGAIRDRGADFILLNVLDPNREVLPKFITYYVQTDSGRTLTGMILAETATSITIRKPDGTNETVLRVNIEELRSTGMSFMPEGLEKSINHQEMADLIAYLMSVR
ncbi:MAG: c-type cytochrome [Planctomycetes bacterium]|nr:c-type cytochrome [Planctomycetota bacterium]